jgi:hypothetical protein
MLQITSLWLVINIQIVVVGDELNYTFGFDLSAFTHDLTPRIVDSAFLHLGHGDVPIYLRGTASFENSSLTDNTVPEISGYDGVIEVRAGSLLRLQNCSFENNAAGYDIALRDATSILFSDDPREVFLEMGGETKVLSDEVAGTFLTEDDAWLQGTKQVRAWHGHPPLLGNSTGRRAPFL